MLVFALLATACADEDLETPPSATASPSATAETSTPTTIATARPVNEQVAEALFGGTRIPVLVYAEAPASTNCRELLPYIVPTSEPLDSEFKRRECSTSAVWAFRLRFSGSLDDVLRLEGVQVLVLMDESGRPWDGAADPSTAPVKGVLQTEVLPPGHDDTEADLTWAPLPERAQGATFAPDVHCWELTRFYDDTQEEPTPVNVRCLLD